MAAVASVLSLMLFLIFATSGLQKLIFNPLMSAGASRLGFTKAAYQRLGALEIFGAVGIVVGLTATGSSLWAIVNEVAAGALAVLMILAVGTHLRRGERWRHYGPALGLAAGALVELVTRVLS